MRLNNNPKTINCKSLLAVVSIDFLMLSYFIVKTNTKNSSPQITEFGACPRKPCNNGYYPIHEAAKNASSKTMEVFFQV